MLQALRFTVYEDDVEWDLVTRDYSCEYKIVKRLKGLLVDIPRTLTRFRTLRRKKPVVSTEKEYPYDVILVEGEGQNKFVAEINVRGFKFEKYVDRPCRDRQGLISFIWERLPEYMTVVEVVITPLEEYAKTHNIADVNREFEVNVEGLTLAEYVYNWIVALMPRQGVELVSEKRA